MKEEESNHILGFIKITLCMVFFVAFILIGNWFELHNSYNEKRNLIEEDNATTNYNAKLKTSKQPSNIVGKFKEGDMYYLVIEKDNGELVKREVVLPHYVKYNFN